MLPFARQKERHDEKNKWNRIPTHYDKWIDFTDPVVLLAVTMFITRKCNDNGLWLLLEPRNINVLRHLDFLNRSRFSLVNLSRHLIAVPNFQGALQSSDCGNRLLNNRI